NAGKRGAKLDLDEPRDLDRLHELCARADILLENLGPTRARRHGLGAARIRARHPRLIHVSMSDFGARGPRATWRLEALPAFAASGALYASGFPDRPPCWLPGYLAHDCGSTFGVVGALAALLERARTDRGQTVEVAVQEAAMSGLYPWSIPLGDYARH